MSIPQDKEGNSRALLKIFHKNKPQSRQPSACFLYRRKKAPIWRLKIGFLFFRRTELDLIGVGGVLRFHAYVISGVSG